MEESYKSFSGILKDDTIKEMAKNQKHLNPRLLKIHNAIQDTLELSELNIVDKCKIAPQLVHGWLSTLYQEEAVLRALQDKAEIIKEEWIKNNGGTKYKISAVNNTIAEKECIEYKKYQKLIKDQDEIVRYLKDSVRILKEFQWHLKNLVNIMQLEN